MGWGGRLSLGGGTGQTSRALVASGGLQPSGLHGTPASCRYHLEQLPSHVSTRLLTCETQPIIVAALQPSDISKMRIPRKVPRTVSDSW